MSDIGTKEASDKWGISQKLVAKYCRLGYVPNATQDKKGCPWHIPQNITLEDVLKQNKNKEGVK